MNKRIQHHPRLMCLSLSILTFLGLYGLRQAGLLQTLELRAYDVALRLRPLEKIDPRIVIIGETEADIRRFGHPLSDQIIADALQRLEYSGARVIGVDKYREVPIAPGSSALHKTLQEHDNILWIFFLGNGEDAVGPPKILRDSQRIGFNDVIDDSDGVLRRGLLFMDDGKNSFYSFPLLNALTYLASEGKQAETSTDGYLKLGDTTILPLTPNAGGYIGADTAGYQFMLDYPGLGQTFPTYSLAQLIDQKIPLDAIKDKLVLFGSVALSLNDYKYLPGGQRDYGVVWHAFATSQFLRFALHERPAMRTVPDSWEYLWLSLWCVAGGWIGLQLRGPTRFAIIAGLGLSVLSLACYAALLEFYWLPVVPPALGWLLAAVLSTAYQASLEKAERHQLMHLFERHVSSEVASTLWQRRQDFFRDGRLQPHRLTATVLFTDLAGFTSTAENMEPLELLEWLNTYMDAMSDIVIAHQGMINKYIGDAIMSVFGVPLNSEGETGIMQDAIAAVQCALAMGKKLRQLNEVWHKNGLPTITMRVGIYTGPLIAGSLGGRQRLEYTVLGDTVNTASRLESFDKSVCPPDEINPCRILIGEATREYLGEHFIIGEVGYCELKGKQEIIKIYRIIELSSIKSLPIRNN